MICEEKPKSVPDLINDYLAENYRYWKKESIDKEEKTDHSIVVEFICNHPRFMILNGLIGKILQKKYKCRLIAAVPGWNMEIGMNVAKSFKFDEYVYLDQNFNFDLKINLSSLLEAKTIEEKRKNLLNFSIDGIKIGDIAYDTYLRTEKKSSIFAIDQKVTDHLAATIRFWKFYDSLVKSKNVLGGVLSHTYYTEYAPLACSILANGGVVFSHHGNCLRCYDKLDELGDNIYTISKSEFDIVYQNYQKEAIRCAEKYLDTEVITINKKNPSYASDAYGSHKKIYSRKELYDVAKFDQDKPTVGIISHVFSDAVHCVRSMVYDDYYQWLVETLEIIKDIPTVNWLIKGHPSNIRYGVVESAEEIARPYSDKCKHISICPTDLNTGCLFDILKCVVTVCGTAGYEFPTQGIPAICTSENHYSELGFVHKAESETAYKDILYRVKDLQPLTEDQKNRAKLFVYCLRDLGSVPSTLTLARIDNFGDKYDIPAMWKEARDRVKNYCLEDDPFYKNFMIQLEYNLPRLLNFDKIGIK